MTSQPRKQCTSWPKSQDIKNDVKISRWDNEIGAVNRIYTMWKIFSSKIMQKIK